MATTWPYSRDPDGDPTVQAYWLLRQWQRRAESDGRGFTARVLRAKVLAIQAKLVRRKVA
jgi:hypothetical protein